MSHADLGTMLPRVSKDTIVIVAMVILVNCICSKGWEQSSKKRTCNNVLQFLDRALLDAEALHL